MLVFSSLQGLLPDESPKSFQIAARGLPVAGDSRPSTTAAWQFQRRTELGSRQSLKHGRRAWHSIHETLVLAK